MLYHFLVHLCGWDQFRTVSLSALHVWNTRGYQSWVWLVHVLCLGRAGSHLAGRVPVHAGPLPLPASHGGAEAQAGERLCLTSCHASQGHDPHPYWNSRAERFFPKTFISETENGSPSLCSVGTMNELVVSLGR